MNEPIVTAHRPVEFPSQGATLRGQFYVPGGRPSGSTVIMAHGFSATMTGMVADRYAEAFQAAGLSVLLFDHRGFGRSGGEPRQTVDRYVQAHGYRDALDFAVAQPEVDPARIAIWGDSNSASTAIGVAAFDPRVAALVVQVPACGSEPAPDDPDGARFAALRRRFEEAEIESEPGETIGPMPVVSADQLRSPSLLTPITAFRWFIDYGGRAGTGWANVASVVMPATSVPYHAGLCAPHLHGPSLWVIAPDDEMPGAEPPVARQVFDTAPPPKELLEIEGGHFGLLYHPSPLFDQVSAAEAEFLVRYLGTTESA